MTIALLEKNDVEALCPHCGEAIKEIYFREITSALGRRYLYFCSQCNKTLGISHRKGFWMG